MPIEDLIRQLSDTIVNELRNPIEDTLQRVLAEVTKLAAEDRDEAVRAALADASEREAATAAQHKADLDEQASRLAAEHESAVAAVREDLARTHERDLDVVREDLARTHERDLDAVRSAAELSGAAALTAAVADAERQREEAVAATREAEQALEQARAEAAEAHDAAADTAQQLDAARAEAAEALKAAEDAAQLREAAHAADREQEMACTDRLLTAIRQLDAARSLTDVLNTLADRAAGESGRAAVLLVTGQRLHAWALRGLPSSDPTAVDAPIEAGTIFGLALGQAHAVSTTEAPLAIEDPLLSSLLAPPDGRAGLAVPILVGGKTVAILYADAAGHEPPVVPATWPELLEILARHAGRCLEALTITHAPGPKAAAQPGAHPQPAVPEAAEIERIEVVQPLADDDADLLGRS